MRKLLLVGFISILAFGCKKAPLIVVKDPGPATLVNGSTIAESSDKTVSIAVPNGWKRGGPDSLSAPSLGDMMGSTSGVEGSPDLQGLAQGAANDDKAADAAMADSLEKKGIVIWVNDSSKPIPGEERTHYSVKVQRDENKSLEDAAKEAQKDVLGSSAATIVDLPIGKAARLQGKVTKIDGGELNQIVYLVVNGADLYKVRFATQNGETVFTAIEKEVIDSLRIKPSSSK